MRALLIVVASLLIVGCSDEFSSEPEWGDLSGVEYSYRDKPFSGVLMVSRYGYDYLGVASPSNDTVWILLNPKHSPYYKQMPQSQFDITQADYEKVKESNLASPTVLIVLQTHIKASK